MRNNEKPEGMGGINDWGLYYNTDYASKNSKKKENERTTFAVRLCPECNRAYETQLNQYKQEPIVYYYPHFYKRGLHEEVCHYCKIS